MDPKWKEKERQATNHLVKDSDDRTGGDGSVMGRSTAGQSTRQGLVVAYDCSLMSLSRDEEDLLLKGANFLLGAYF